MTEFSIVAMLILVSINIYVAVDNYLYKRKARKEQEQKRIWEALKND